MRNAYTWEKSGGVKKVNIFLVVNPADSRPAKRRDRSRNVRAGMAVANLRELRARFRLD